MISSKIKMLFRDMERNEISEELKIVASREKEVAGKGAWWLFSLTNFIEL